MTTPAAAKCPYKPSAPTATSTDQKSAASDDIPNNNNNNSNSQSQLATLSVPTAATSKCPYKPGIKLKSPHRHEEGVYDRCVGPIASIYPDILSHIGMTPMVRINNIGKEEGILCEMVAKCEYFNAGGSVKDRIGRRMIIDAEKKGLIKKGDTLIEPTSGNTGIGLALSAAIRGYKMIITLPEKMSSEKVFMLRALGAKIHRTPTDAAFDSWESHIGLANKLNAQIANSYILDQYCNPSNPLAHYDGTAEEILKQCNNRIDCIVMTAGTGGTITGIAGKIKEKLPKCLIVGVDPCGSILAQPSSLNGAIKSYHVEGIGYDFVPQVLQRRLVDYWVKTSDRESFIYARKLIRKEGLFVGGSSGSVMIGAIKAIKELNDKYNINMRGKRVVVLLPDSVRNYMSKFLSDDWMINNGFMDDPNIVKHEWWHNHTCSNLNIATPITMSSSLTCKSAINIMKSKSIDQIPIMNVDNDTVFGVITVGNLSSKLLSSRIKPNDKVTKAAFKKFETINLTTKLTKLSKLFNTNHFVLVITESLQYNDNNSISKKQMVIGIITRIDLLNYIATGASNIATTPTASNNTATTAAINDNADNKKDDMQPVD